MHLTIIPLRFLMAGDSTRCVIINKGVIVFKELKEINSRPAPFQFYTADELWTNEHTSKQMLEYHLNESIDASSRNKGYVAYCTSFVV